MARVLYKEEVVRFSGQNPIAVAPEGVNRVRIVLEGKRCQAVVVIEHPATAPARFLPSEEPTPDPGRLRGHLAVGEGHQVLEGTEAVGPNEPSVTWEVREKAGGLGVVFLDNPMDEFGG